MTTYSTVQHSHKRRDMAEPTVDARQAAAAALPQPTILQFTPFTSSLLPEFWTSLSKLKIDKLKLDESPIPVRGSYSGGRSIVDRETGQQVGLGCMCNIDGDALDDEQQQGREPSRESQRCVRARTRGLLTGL